MNVVKLFPEVLGHTEVDTPLDKDGYEFVLNQETKSNLGNRRSINSYILDSAELSELKLKLLSYVKEYLYNIKLVNDTLIEPYITQSWVNYTEPGEYHHSHRHPNSLISGVLYLHGEGENDKITFYNRFAGFVLPVTGYNDLNSREWWLPADTNSLFLFPSNLVHGVTTTTSSSTRVSLAFNVFIKGTVGEKEQLTELHLN